MLFPDKSHTMEKLLCHFEKRCFFFEKKYAIPTLKKKQLAAGASGKRAGRVFRAVSRVRGSLTVEAALALPVCLGILLALAGLVQAMMVEEQVNQQLCMTVRKAAAYSVAKDGVSEIDVRKCFYESVAGGGLQTDLVSGGAAGILLHVTENQTNGVFCVQAAYRIRLPGAFGLLRTVTVRDVVYGRAFTGIELPDHTGEAQHAGSGQHVYVAENGVVYHTDSHCTYLDLSIHAADASALEKLRNLSGSRYQPCEKCAHGKAAGTVYITNQGEAWHTDPLCSGLKRTIELQSEEEAHAHGLRACPRCGGK